MKWHAETCKNPFLPRKNTRVARTLTSIWRSLSCSQYSISASHVAEPCRTFCLFLNASISSQILRKDFKVKIQTIWTQLWFHSVYVFRMQFFCLEIINFMINHSQGGPENSKMIVFDKRFALFCLTLLNSRCSFFQSMSRLIQRLGHPWMKKHKPEIPQEDHWSWQTSNQKTVCIETHDITSISESNKDFLVAHRGFPLLQHTWTGYYRVFPGQSSVRVVPFVLQKFSNWILLPLQNIPVISACVFDLCETQWPDCLNTFKRPST